MECNDTLNVNSELILDRIIKIVHSNQHKVKNKICLDFLIKMEKSNQKSNILRQEGNEFYSNKQFFQALLKYNQSLCFAEDKSENLGLAYANRSAVYFEIKSYDKCLDNIDLAIINRYPNKNVQILESRRVKCRELIKNENKSESEIFFKLSLPANKNLPFLANCLKIETNEKYGRYVITTSDLSVGDVIAIDKPFCSVPISESNFVKVPEFNIYQRCNCCLKSNQLNLIPCQSCCCVMFCSQECYEFAMSYYHQFECPIITDILKSGSVNMSLRIFFISLSLFNGDICKLKTFFEENQKNAKNIFDFDFSSMHNSDKILSQLKCLLGLSKSSKQYSITLQANILKNHPKLESVYNENSDFIKLFLQNQCQISAHNFHGIFSSNLSIKSLDDTNFKSLQEPVGSGSFLFTSLINHSCTPNILRICMEGKIYIIVCRRIEKGLQLFDCYKNNFLMETKDQRQNILLKEFNFSCDCEACKNDWPTLKKLTVKDMKLLKYAKKINDELIESFTNHSKLTKNFKNCKNILQDNYKSYPSMELCVVQKTLATFLLKFAAQENISI